MRKNQDIRQLIDAGLSYAEFSQENKRNVFQFVKGENAVKRKISTGYILVIVLVLMAISVAVAASLIGPELINRFFGNTESDRVTSAFDLVGESEGYDVHDQKLADGMTATIHYVTTDGVDLAILFSIKRDDGSMISLDDMGYWAEIHFADASVYCSDEPILKQDTDTNTVYGLAKVKLVDWNGDIITIKEDEEVTLTIQTLQRATPSYELLCALTVDGINSLDVGSNMATELSGASEFMIEEISVGDEVATLDYSLIQKDDSPSENAFLLVISDENDIPLNPENAGYKIVNGKDTMTFSLDSAAKLALVTDHLTTFERTGPSWQFALDLLHPQEANAVVFDVNKSIVVDSTEMIIKTVTIRPIAIDIEIEYKGVSEDSMLEKVYYLDLELSANSEILAMRQPEWSLIKVDDVQRMHCSISGLIDNIDGLALNIFHGDARNEICELKLN